MKKIIATFALSAFAFSGVGFVSTATATAKPCAFGLGNFCTDRNEDNPMAPYEGKKSPKSAKKAKSSPKSSR